MIRSHEDFGVALEEATRLLDAPPAEGTPAHARVLGLMRDIAAYRPSVIPDIAKAETESEQLAKRLDEFESRLAPPFSSHWHSMIGGDFSGSKS